MVTVTADMRKGKEVPRGFRETTNIMTARNTQKRKGEEQGDAEGRGWRATLALAHTPAEMLNSYRGTSLIRNRPPPRTLQ